MTRVDINNRVEEILGGGIICSTCGATLQSYSDVCTAALDGPCEGTGNIDAALDQARDEAEADERADREAGDPRTPKYGVAP